jgi:serine O-acetyltransferase
MKRMLDSLRCDLQRYHPQGAAWLKMLETVFFSPGIWGIMIYRAGNHLTRMQNHVFRRLFMLPMRILKLLVCVPIGIDISFDSFIGKGFYIGHYGGIVIGEDVEIGERCNISQGVTIGIGGRGEKRGSPKIGNRVYIGPGAKIFGKITIGDDVAIGANAVVLKDVPNCAVIGGVPAVILNYNSSKDFIR